ncbi:MAG: hypothetical protein IIZ20_10555 [Butyrivibrio sp.]|nr:hypothetical protein [Butyrivibrio sp.]
MKTKMILMFIGGLIVGIGGGFAAGWIIKEKLDDKMFEDIAKELDRIENEYAKKEEEESVKKLDPDAGTIEGVINKYKGVEVNPVKTDSVVEKLNKIPEKIVLTEEQANLIRKNNEKRQQSAGPIVISAEDYLDDEDNDGWDKQEYRYYPSADLLVDDINDVRVMDYTYDIGSEALDIIRNAPEGEETMVFVRNPYLGCDIQITVDWDEPNAEFYDVPDLNDMDGGVKG